jgi:hypothetical protein
MKPYHNTRATFLYHFSHFSLRLAPQFHIMRGAYQNTKNYNKKNSPFPLSFISFYSVPYMGKGAFAIIVNQTENKAKTASCDDQFFIPGFPASKLRAEKIVLSSHGRKLSNGTGKSMSYGIKFLK